MLLDHICTNDLTKPVFSGVLTNFDLNDLYSIFVIISKKTCHENRQGVDYKVRDMTQFDWDKFLDYLDNKLSSLCETPLISVNELFELFLATFAETIDQFAPKRKATRKEKRLRLEYHEVYLHQFKQKTGYSSNCNKNDKIQCKK